MRKKTLIQMCKRSSNEIITHNDFNAGFFKASLKANGNVGNYVASPLSVLVLLSALLTSKGPEGKTAKEICQAIVGKREKETCSDLKYPNIEQKLDRIRTGAANSKTEDGKKILSLSNAVFLRKGLHIYPGFLERFAGFGEDRVKQVLFNTSEAFEKINEWSCSSTDGLIEHFLKSKDELSSDTLMVLLSAIAFKDNWAKTFMVENTVKRDFYLKKGVSVKVPMMHLGTQMVYLKQDRFKVVAKPFRNYRYKFVIFLPNERFNLNEIENDLEDGDFNWRLIQSDRNYTHIELGLPKFKVEHEINLKSVLRLLGVRRFFAQESAELTGISSHPRLYAGEAKQVAVMEVDEAGVKAAAVSSIEILPMSLPPPSVPFIVDQPFYCAIYDSFLQMPLFIARIADPR
ncbi:Alpha-1-antitrypsin-like protein CM55-MM [Echinococcus granulosus]|uniref:Estrogen regulated protein EP45 n=2 Tax=Echinococcus granulosus TaxID=6210 RepID=A0A068WDZ3_ECHGR|nr:Alpha-1-antitrypsin-like protein CM55-MM [Echinococcus granulosus]CDS15831.1 Estrogen regulated protein EP45 [Echinococcus granulosus]